MHDAVIALLWEGQPNIMGPGRIRELFSDPVRLYSLFIFLLRLPYHPFTASSLRISKIVKHSEWKMCTVCMYVCMFVVLNKV